MVQAVTVTIPHQLGVAEARRRVDRGFADLARHLGAVPGALDRNWRGDRLTFSLTSFGHALSGQVLVAETAVTVELLLPGVLGLLAGKLTGTLEREGRLLLGRK